MQNVTENSDSIWFS